MTGNTTPALGYIISKTTADHFDDGSVHGCCKSAFYIVLKMTKAADFHGDTLLCELARHFLTETVPLIT